MLTLHIAALIAPLTIPRIDKVRLLETYVFIRRIKRFR